VSHESKAESLSGTLQQLLFSPKGEIEGLLIKGGAKSVQISVHHGTVDARALADAVGESIDVTVSRDHSTVLGRPSIEAREVNRVAID
jgi:hypothetical protein